MIRVRAATIADVTEILPRTRALNAQENIVVDDALLQAALHRLLGDPSLGIVWLVEDEGPIGHAVVTYGFDLEFAGRDSFLTEFWIDEPHRSRGAGAQALELIVDELRALDVRALHLGVRPENPARRLYERAGFTTSPRLLMTRLLA